MHIDLPENVEKIINRLQSAGFEAYAVGGCVRDSLLGRTPNDWDITTSAEPYETKALFKRTFDTGIQHGTVSVLMDKEIHEVTTYRIDGLYEDARHPKNVTFTRELKEDLLRRDFTINAMAYNHKDGLVDLYDGVSDLKNGVIRCVGNPMDRLSEDALRIMRAVRFAAQLNYQIEESTLEAIRVLAPNLSKISAERIQTELVKILTSDNPGYIKLAYELGITKYFLPEFDAAMETLQNNPNHCYTVGEHILKVLENVPNDKVLRIAALLHDLGKVETRTTDDKGIDHFAKHPLAGEKIAHEFFRRLKFDTDTENKVCRIVRFHDWFIGADVSKIRHYINRIGEDAFPKIFDFNRADMLAQSDYNREEKLVHIEKLKKAYEEVIEAGDCVSLKTLAVNGKDLKEAGIAPGPLMGEILNNLLEVVLDNPSLNTKEYLISLVEKGNNREN